MLQAVEEVFSGLFLLTCFFISILFIFVAFTAQEFQTRVHALNARQKAGVIYAMGTLEVKVREYQARKERLGRLAAERDGLKTCLRKFLSRTLTDRDSCADYLKLQQEIVASQGNVLKARHKLLEELYRFPSPDKLGVMTDSQLLQLSGEVRRALFTKDIPDPTGNSIAALDVASGALSEAISKDPVSDGRARFAEEQTLQAIRELGEEGVAIETEFKAYDQEFLRLIDDANAYRSVLFEWPFGYISLPSITLTLIITLFMGILGSAIALTRELVFDGRTYPISLYLFRVGLSAAVAIAVFFAASAGILVVAKSSTGGTSGTIEISPSLVAFTAIIAGYLSLRVTDWLGEVGTEMFRTQQAGADAKPRYGIGLQSRVDAVESGRQLVAQALATTADEIGKMLSDPKHLYSFEEQSLIAAVLHCPLGELFTDIPPRIERSSSGDVQP